MEESIIHNAPIVVKAHQVSKHFIMRKDNSLKERIVAFSRGRSHREEFHALRDVSFEVSAGTTVALIGHNGSGKSTLLKVIGGIIDPSDGSIQRRGRIAALLELGAGFHPDLTGRDNVYLNASLLGLTHAETTAVFDSIVEFAELEEFIDTQVKFYSSGMYVRLAFAVAIHTDPEILLVDEVLAVGDEAFQRKCMDVIRRFQAEGRTILLVTHNLGQVLDLCDSAVLLHHGELVYNGDPREAVNQFRNLLEERRLSHLGDVEGSETPNITVRADALVVGREPHEPAVPGDSIEVSVKISGEVSATGWYCGVQIDNTMGQGVIWTNTKLLDVPLAPLSGTQDLTFTFKNTSFGEGKYFINVSIMNADGEHVFDLLQACSFDARSPGDSRGTSYFPISVRTD